MNFEEELQLLVKSRYPLVWVETYDEEYVTNRISEIAKSCGLRHYQWSISKGLRFVPTGEGLYDSQEPLKMLKNLTDLVFVVKEKAVYVLYDLDKYLDNATVMRYFKDILEKIKGTPTTIILVSAGYKEMKDLSPYTARLTGGFPDEKEIFSMISAEIMMIKKSIPDLKIDLQDAHVKRIIGLLKGLTGQQIKNVISKCVIDDRCFDLSDVPTIEKAKKDIFDREGILEYYTSESSAAVGGFANLKKWIALRKKFFLKRDPSMPPPKGLMIVGVSGCGKSLAAKAIGGELGIPLYRLDVTKLYSKYIGETEENVRKAFEILKKLAPVCIWIDEIEKIFSASSGEIDGGVSKRILGSFLTWMQERKEESFIVATSNDINSMPTEFLRKGRFDEIFFVDLPAPAEREAIFGIHLAKRGIKLPAEDVRRLSGALTEGFNGSEIEQAVISAMYSAEDSKKISGAEIECQLKLTTPLSRMRSEEISSLRDWAKEKNVLYV